jgi:alkanesulfonate monooxygenase SsuD/methylene tetrahydromethanopterin reductase-like flavin-dependent oxidoreductase (luciferase family)
MHTHGLGMRDEEIWRLQVLPAAEMRPAKIAQLAERFGYHSVWCSDHILVTRKPGVGLECTLPFRGRARAEHL